MEDPAILRGVIQWLFPRGRITFKAILLWLIVVALFTGCGFIDSGGCESFDVSGVEGAVPIGGLGVGLATCITVGLLILAGVQANRWGKWTAIFHLVTSSFVSTVSTPVVILLMRPLFPQVREMLSGEGVLSIGIVSGWMGMAAIALFVLFTISVLLSRQRAMAVLRPHN